MEFLVLLGFEGVGLCLLSVGVIWVGYFGFGFFKCRVFLGFVISVDVGILFF